MTDTPRHVAAPAHKRRVLKIVAASVAAVLVVVVGGGFLVYRHLNNNISSMDVTKDLGPRPVKVQPVKPEPTQPLNVLILGSDTRAGQSGHIGGETPGLSDTTILLHLSADRKLAYGVSLPRDAMVQRPACKRKGKGNGTDPGGLTQFNEAYAIGGPACTINTIEALTHVYVDHFVVIDFDGFRKMVNALDGVQVCVPEPVNDTIGHIQLPAGTYDVKGQRALDYVRVRHGIGTVDTGDIGRMKRQQAFLASMAKKVVSAGTLANPIRLYKFADAATKSLTTDPGLASLGKLRGLASSFSGIGLSKIQFLTVPYEAYPPDHNRLQWAPAASTLWKRMRNDKPLTGSLRGSVTTAADKNGTKSNGSTSANPSATPASRAKAEQAAAKAKAAAAVNGLCA